MKKDSMGDRMKANYENRYRLKLTRRMPVVMRFDGKAFHTLTRNCDKPFDESLKCCMVETAEFLCSEIQGAKFAYVQSDEISLLLTDFDTLQTDGWFDYNIQKMCSVAAGYASAKFSELWPEMGIFDCRVFNIPKEEVCNYFIWRQKDWERNSLQMFAQAHFSHKELQGKKTPDMHEMLHSKGLNWAKLPSEWKNGVSIFKYGTGWTAIGDKIFMEDRQFVECYMEPKEESTDL